MLPTSTVFFLLPCYYMFVMLMCTRAYVVPTSSAEYEDGLMPRRR